MVTAISESLGICPLGSRYLSLRHCCLNKIGWISDWSMTLYVLRLALMDNVNKYPLAISTISYNPNHSVIFVHGLMTINCNVELLMVGTTLEERQPVSRRWFWISVSLT